MNFKEKNVVNYLIGFTAHQGYHRASTQNVDMISVRFILYQRKKRYLQIGKVHMMLAGMIVLTQ